MKKKTIFQIIFLCIVSVGFFSSCEKESNGINLRAYIDDDFGGAKVHLANGYTAWDNGDRLRINNTTTSLGGGIYEVTVSGSTFSISGVAKNNSGYRAVYPSSLGTVSANHYYQMTLPAVQTYNPTKIPIPMVAHTTAENASSGLHFRAVTALMCVRVIGNITVNSIEVTASTAPLCGKGTIQVTDTIQETDPVLVLESDTSKTVTLDCGEGVEVTTQHDFYVIIPAISDTSNKFTITINGKGISNNGEYIVGSFSRTQPKSASGAIERSALGVVPFDVNNSAVNVSVSTHTGRLCGRFKISNNQYVNFSMGNLIHNGGTWSFAENQYSYLGSANSTNITSDGAIDLFGWGTSGYSSYSPYNYFGNAGSSQTQYPYGMNNITKTVNDWGWNNKITNGGNKAGQWYTLTSGQWQYILENHTHSWSKVAGTYGLIILPDGSTASIANTYTENEWKPLAVQGAVFLPAAGFRNGISNGSNPNVTSVNARGCYWTGSYSGNEAAHYLGFKSDHGPVVTNGDSELIATPTRFRGFAVRLVADAL